MTDPQIIERPSPNHDARPDGQAVDILLLHYTGMESGAAHWSGSAIRRRR